MYALVGLVALASNRTDGDAKLERETRGELLERCYHPVIRECMCVCVCV